MMQADKIEKIRGWQLNAYLLVMGMWCWKWYQRLDEPAFSELTPDAKTYIFMAKALWEKGQLFPAPETIAGQPCSPFPPLFPWLMAPFSAFQGPFLNLVLTMLLMVLLLRRWGTWAWAVLPVFFSIPAFWLTGHFWSEWLAFSLIFIGILYPKQYWVWVLLPWSRYAALLNALIAAVLPSYMSFEQISNFSEDRMRSFFRKTILSPRFWSILFSIALLLSLNMWLFGSWFGCPKVVDLDNVLFGNKPWWKFLGGMRFLGSIGFLYCYAPVLAFAQIYYNYSYSWKNRHNAVADLPKTTEKDKNWTKLVFEYPKQVQTGLKQFNLHSGVYLFAVFIGTLVFTSDDLDLRLYGPSLMLIHCSVGIYLVKSLPDFEYLPAVSCGVCFAGFILA